MRRMNRTLLPVAAALASFACADSRPTGPAARPGPEAQLSRSAGPRCRNVEGTILERITGPNTAAGTISGDLSGDVSIEITSLTPSGSGALHFEGVCRIVTPQGTVTTSDAAVLSPIDPPLYRVNNRLEVSGGTGMYAGVAGTLHTHGTAHFVPGGMVELRYHGRLCDGQ